MYSIGLDVSKSTISVHIPRTQADIEIKNSAAQIKGLYAKLKKLYKKEIEKVVFVYEPTGSYSVLLDRFCHQKKIRVFQVNPKQSSNYAKARGERNKTDKADARMLSKAIDIAKEEQIKVPAYNATAQEIKELMSYYSFTVKQRVKTSNHLEALTAKEGSAYAIKDLKKRIAVFRRQEKEILDQIIAVIAKDTALQKGFENIKSIVGIGNVAAIALLHLFICYEGANRAQVVSLAGLDPVERTSGSSLRSRSKISKAGARIYRGTLFMAALVATRHNDEMKSFFARLKSTGKHTTVAQTAVMRKLLVIAHSLYKNDKVYDPERYKMHSGQKESAT